MNTNYESIRGKKVLLFSAGMDSYMINQLEEPDVLLFINNKSVYADIEEKFLRNLQAQGYYPNLVFLDDFINMKDLERTDYIIPSRNAYFILRAAEYGDEIILGATIGDRSTDKDLKFASQMTDLLNHIYESSHWVGELGRSINVNFKYKGYSKSMIINKLIEKRMNDLEVSKEYATKKVVEELCNLTISCYDFQEEGEEKKACGVCKPCTRKWLAILGLTGIDTAPIFHTNPREYFTDEVIDQWIAKESGANNRGIESKEIIDTLTKLKNHEI